MADVPELLKEAMVNAGIAPPDEIIADGNLHRFTPSGDRPRSNNGWYVLHVDGIPAAIFGTWKDAGVSHKWTAKAYQSMTHAEKAAYTSKMEAMKQQREAERRKLQAECRKWCADTWEKAEDATNEHPYLRSKGVPAYGLKTYKDSLLVPVRDVVGTIHGLQFIQGDGSKRFKTGTAKEGRFFKIGATRENTLFICEGYATGASIHEATGDAVVVGFDAGNLLSVALGLRSKFPDMKMIFAADNDQWTAGNPGVTKATEAARAVGGLLAVPIFEGVGHE